MRVFFDEEVQRHVHGYGESLQQQTGQALEVFGKFGDMFTESGQWLLVETMIQINLTTSGHSHLFRKLQVECADVVRVTHVFQLAVEAFLAGLDIPYEKKDSLQSMLINASV